MQCSECKSEIEDDVKFCNNCGATANAEIECIGCRTLNSANSKFCKGCGKNLSENSGANDIGCDEEELIDNSGGSKEVVKGKTFFVELHEIYSNKFRERMKAYDDIEDKQAIADKATLAKSAKLHAFAPIGLTVAKNIIKSKISDDSKYPLINAFTSSMLKNDFISSIDKCFKFLNNSIRDVMDIDGSEYILEVKTHFLENESSDLFDVLDELEEKSASYLESYEQTGLVKIKDGAMSGSGVGGLLGFVPFGKVLDVGIGAAKAVKENSQEIDKMDSLWKEWLIIKMKIHEEFNAMWHKLVDLFINEIFQNIPACLAEDESGELDDLLKLTNAMTV